jgi:hypothetical protein
MPNLAEIARTAFKTLAFAEVAALRPHLVAEIAIWSGSLLAGRADAVAVDNGNILAVVDCKSDVAPGQSERSSHICRLGEYPLSALPFTPSMAARGARRTFQTSAASCPGVLRDRNNLQLLTGCTD